MIPLRGGIIYVALTRTGKGKFPRSFISFWSWLICICILNLFLFLKIHSRHLHIPHHIYHKVRSCSRLLDLHLIQILHIMTYIFRKKFKTPSCNWNGFCVCAGASVGLDCHGTEWMYPCTYICNPVFEKGGRDYRLRTFEYQLRTFWHKGHFWVKISL